MKTEHSNDLAAAAYREAWRAISENNEMSPDEIRHAPRILRSHVLRLVNEGLGNATDIANIAVGSLRQNEQISQSAERVRAGVWVR
jgi:hypothetical protein